MKEFKDKYKGEILYMVGNGPSLNKTDLSLLEGKYTFCMNRFSLLYNKINWRPTFYVYCSTNVRNKVWGKKWRASIRDAIAEKATQCFIWDRFKNDILEKNEDPNNVEWFTNVTEHGAGKPNTFSYDAEKQLDKSGTTMSVAFQLATYMGFKKIIIIGADVNWVSSKGIKSDPNHFTDEYQAHIANGEKDRAETRKTHMNCYKYMREKNMFVYNATVETFLDVYPLINLETDMTKVNFKDDEPSKNIAEKRAKITKYWKTNKYV